MRYIELDVDRNHAFEVEELFKENGIKTKILYRGAAEIPLIIQIASIAVPILLKIIDLIREKKKREIKEININIKVGDIKIQNILHIEKNKLESKFKEIEQRQEKTSDN